MPYSISTKDGITINGIPDDVLPDAPELKQRVASERQKRDGGEPSPAPVPATPEAPAPTGGNMVRNALEMAGAANPISGAIRAIAPGVISGLKGNLLGARQFAADTFGIGDKEQLAQEAKQHALDDAKARQGVSGMVGGMFGDVAPSLLGGMGVGGAVAKGVSMIPKAAEVAAMLPKIIRALPGMAAGGATSELLSPSENYDAGDKALQGAGMGTALGMGATAAFKGPQIAARRIFGLNKGDSVLDEAAARVKSMLPDFPILAKNVKQGGFAQAATNAIEQSGFGSGPIKASEAAQDRAITAASLRRAGKELPDITTLKPLKDELVATAESFKAGPDVPMPQMVGPLAEARDAILKSADFVGKQSGPTALQRGIESSTPTIPGRTGREPSSIQATIDAALSNQPGPRIANTLEKASSEMPGHYTGTAPASSMGIPAIPNSPTLTAEEAMRLRSIASDIAHGMADNPSAALERGAYRKLRDELDDAIKSTLPKEDAAAFDKWRRQWGAYQDTLSAAHSAGPKAQQLSPTDLWRQLGQERVKNPAGPYDQLVADSALLSNPAPQTENRSLMTRGIMEPGRAALGGSSGQNFLANVLGGGAGLLGVGKLLGTEGGTNYLRHGASDAANKTFEELRRLMILQALHGNQ